MKKNSLAALIGLCLILGASFRSHAQARVKITGEVNNPLNLSAADVQKMPHQLLTQKDRDGNNHVYAGVLLSALLKQAGTTLGKELRGENLTKYVLVEASDGYQIIFSLAELDADFSDNVILLVDSMDAKPLPAADGPFRMIVEKDKRPARCIKQVTNIKIGFAK
ncbi:molybdopterin-dependent oxidoreductase [Pedobacter sp. MW01-1-1]|uniref:molybdopterin-dependent oxidoreductase n=1 Tax=Pedobacter sp. MW01-1-1 TaxID=3383027 RepID=UPI003FEE197A